MIFVTIDDDSGDFVCIEDIVACQATERNEHGFKAILFMDTGHPCGTPLTPAEIRSRIDTQLGRAVN